MKTAARNRKHGRSTCFRKRNVFRLPLNESRECFCWIRRGRSFHVDRPKTKKARKPKVESGARNLEAKSIRSRAEYGRVCKVEDSHRNKTEQSLWYIYSRECLFCTLSVGLGAIGETKTEVWYVVRFTLFQYVLSSTILYATKTVDRGSRQARKERTAVVKVWQNEWGDQFHCSLSEKILPDWTTHTKAPDTEKWEQGLWHQLQCIDQPQDTGEKGLWCQLQCVDQPWDTGVTEGSVTSVSMRGPTMGHRSDRRVCDVSFNACTNHGTQEWQKGLWHQLQCMDQPWDTGVREGSVMSASKRGPTMGHRSERRVHRRGLFPLSPQLIFTLLC